MDTRAGGDNVGPRAAAIGAGETYAPLVWGANGNCNIPTSATAVSMNVTFVNPTAPGHLTVYPPDASQRPLTSSLNWVAGQAPAPNAVTSRLSADGHVGFYNLAGSVDVIADVVGYYEPSGSSSGGAAGTQGAPGAAGPTGPVGPTGAAGTSGAQFGRQISSTMTLNSTGAVGLSTSASIGADGDPVISYYDATNADLMVVKCQDPVCAFRWWYTAVDTTGSVGTASSITVGADGNPVISYYDLTNGDLKVIKCNDPACVGGNEAMSTVDSIADVGFYSSIAIGADADPVISYFDVTNVDLKMAKCNDPACAGGDEMITAIDSAGNVGSFTSITIGSNANPIISYYDAGNADLKVAMINHTSWVANNWGR